MLRLLYRAWKNVPFFGKNFPQIFDSCQANLKKERSIRLSDKALYGTKKKIDTPKKQCSVGPILQAALLKMKYEKPSKNQQHHYFTGPICVR